ncbi:MAG: glycosyltransferase family 4 protein, partial [Flavisolibacter sp.]
WALLEDQLSVFHKMLRKVVYRSSETFIACSVKGKKYFESYNIPPGKIFISPLIIDNNVFSNNNSTHQSRPYDLLFSGRLIGSKNPGFFIQVAGELKKAYKNDIRLLVIGDGPLRDEIISEMDKEKLDYHYPGFVSQEELPFYYGSAKLLLFPTSFDAWGVVANEAQSAGTPVIVTPYAGCSDELILDNYNGFVVSLDVKLWVDKCSELLGNESLWKTFSERAKLTAGEFNADKAAAALIDACRSSIKIGGNEK